MLVLTRRFGESIMIGDDIEVKILKITGNSIKIGIAAPKDVSVLRSELAKKEQEIPFKKRKTKLHVINGKLCLA